jgi:hypothetical protein
MAFRFSYGALPSELEEADVAGFQDYVLGTPFNSSTLKRFKINSFPFPYQKYKTVDTNYVLSPSDHGTILLVSATVTITLPNGLSNGFQVTVYNLIEQGIILFNCLGALTSKSTTLSNQYGAVYLGHVNNNSWIGIGDFDVI